MNKAEFQLEVKRLDVRRFEGLISLAKHVISGLVLLSAIWLILAGLKPLITDMGPSSLNALARIVEAFNLGSLWGYIWGAIATGAAVIERRGKKRAIKQKSKYQKIAEQHEPNRTSSGLTTTGSTPKKMVKS